LFHPALGDGAASSTGEQALTSTERKSYGQENLSFVDRLGVWLSQRAIARELPSGSDLEVLELGCGYRATQLIELGPRLKRGVGVDFQLAPELANLGNFSFYQGTIEDALPKLISERFDAVMLISVLEHLRDPLSVMEAASGLLKPSGVMLINVPTWRGKAFLEFSAFRLGFSPKVEMDDHKMYYDKRDLWPLLVRAGFKPSLVKLRYHKFGLNLFAVARRENG
jgi:SAM-dependent methyltransferase